MLRTPALYPSVINSIEAFMKAPTTGENGVNVAQLRLTLETVRERALERREGFDLLRRCLKQVLS